MKTYMYMFNNINIYVDIYTHICMYICIRYIHIFRYTPMYTCNKPFWWGVLPLEKLSRTKPNDNALRLTISYDLHVYIRIHI